MNKTKIIFAVGIASLLISSPVFAESATGTKSRESGMEKREVAKERVSDKREELEAKKSELKTEVSAKRMELVKKFAAKMVKVHQAAVNRLDKLADRIEARIAKFEVSKNVNLDEAEALLVAARAKITIAQNYLNTIPGMVTTATATGTPATAFSAIKGYFATSRDNLKDAHGSLVDVISSIKVGMKIASSTATTTP
ncbi:MAG: hypothetical protein AAB590_00370 [Patescibacteria group bacterium]